MNRVLRIFIVIYVVGWAFFASPVFAYHHPFTIGLVEVPKIFDESGIGDGKGTVSLRTSPSLKSSVAQIITKAGQFDRHEHGYNASSAVVYEVKFAWYRVGYAVNGKKGKAWLSPDDAGEYRPLSKLMRGLPSFIPVWNGRLFEHPSETAPFKKLLRKPSYARPVAIAKRTERPGTLWYLVVILKDDGCGGVKFLDHVVAAGWVPFYNEEGLSNLRFSPRGC